MPRREINPNEPRWCLSVSVSVSVSVSAVPIPTLLTPSHVLPHHSRQKQYVALPDYSIVSPFFLAPEFLEAIRSVNPPSRWKILVIDEHSQELLNFVLKKFDILEENVTRELDRTPSSTPCLTHQWGYETKSSNL